MRLDKDRLDELVGHVLQAARTAFGPHLRAGILKGSAYKGDFFPGYSDLDVHLFIADEVMRSSRVPETSYALAFQEQFGTVRPEDYGISQCQIYFITWSHYPYDWVRPIPGTYRLIYGELPPGFDEVDVEEHRRNAERYLLQLDGLASWLIGGFVDKPDDGLWRYVRLLGTFLKPLPYQILIVQGGDPAEVWRRRLAGVLAEVEPVACPSRRISAFFEAVRDWEAIYGQPDQARRLLRIGLEAVDEVSVWYGMWGLREASSVERNE